MIDYGIDQLNMFEKDHEPAKLQFQLRPYQSQAIAKLMWAQGLPGNDLCVLPTGAGKSVVIAHLAKELRQPILILQPSKEILEQNVTKLLQYVDSSEVGIYSASMNEKIIRFFTFATIQSIYTKPEQFAHFRMVIVDECHAINPKNLGGMFTRFLKAIGSPKVIGFTATPYRMDTMYIQSKDDFFEQPFLKAVATIKLINRMKARFWDRLIFNINNQELLDQGYLAPLSYIDHSFIDHSEIPVSKSLSDFDLEAYETKISKREQEILDSIAYAKNNCKHILVFCSSVKQAERLQKLVDSSAVVTGKTPKADRDEIISHFKSGKIPIVFNVGVLTTGFDHPALDCIVLLRPTRSIALYYQMLGRGVRTSQGKVSCKVIDLTSTVRNLGRIETIKLERENGKWELKSERGYWHNQQLYSYVIERKDKKEEKPTWPKVNVERGEEKDHV